MMSEDFLENCLTMNPPPSDSRALLKDLLNRMKQGAQQCEKNSIELVRLKRQFETGIASLECYQVQTENETRQLSETYNRLLIRLFSILDEMDTERYRKETTSQYFSLQLEESLHREGIEKFTPQPGDSGDPMRHEMLGVKDHTAYPDNYIVEVVHCGYLQKGRVLRRAGVILSKKSDLL